MGFTIGEVTMVNFVILNSKSLPFRNKYDFEKEILEFFKILTLLSTKKYYIEIRTNADFSNLTIYSNLNIQKVIKQIENRDLKSKLISFLSNKLMTVINPISENEKDDYGLLEYCYENEENRELGYAHIFGTLTLSFLTNKKWENNKLKLLKTSLIGAKEIKEEVEIDNISKEAHFYNQNIKDFLAGKRLEMINNIANNYKNYKNIFSKVIVNKEVEKELEFMKNSTQYRDFMTIIYDLECQIKYIEDYTISNESKSVRNNKKMNDERKFKFDDGTFKYVYTHIKNFSSGYRLYFHEENSKIYICYFGKHLSNKTDKKN